MNTETRHTVVGRILALYLIPMLFLTAYTLLDRNSWNILCLGLMLSALGSFCCFWMVRRWEENFQPVTTVLKEAASPPDVTPYLAQVEAKEKERADAEQKLLSMEQEKQGWAEAHDNLLRERELHQRQTEGVRQEFQLYKNNAHEQLEHHKTLLSEHQRTIGELREALENRQQYIQQLEGKTRDLNFELKTLLQITEKPIDPMPELVKRSETPKLSEVDVASTFDKIVQTPEEAHVQLKRCLDIAQRMMGASHFSNNSRFRDLSLDSFALDFRSLFDSLRDVSSSTVVVYSPKENKLLFVNDQVKHLLGVTPEKFVQTFQEQLHTGLDEWKVAIEQLAFKNESKLSLSLKARTGQELPVECLLGMVPTGLFRHYVIGLLYRKNE